MSRFTHTRGTRVDLPGSGRCGFTLVEMMAVMAIIALLGGIVLSVVQFGLSVAKEARTKSLIRKLDNQLRIRWESYRDRRPPVDIFAAAQAFNESTGGDRYRPQGIRIEALLELQRLELPDRWEDIIRPPRILAADQYVGNPNAFDDLNTDVQISNYESNNYSGPTDAFRPAASVSYWQIVREKLLNEPSWNWRRDNHQGAECLFLIMTVGLGAEGISATDLAEGSYGDVDNDGFFEFHDGWGNPIAFIRWPAGFVSDLQPIQVFDDGSGTLHGVRILKPTGSRVIGLQDLRTMSSIIDPGGMSLFPDDPGVAPARGFSLYPLIYSAGPDGVTVGRIDHFWKAENGLITHIVQGDASEDPSRGNINQYAEFFIVDWWVNDPYNRWNGQPRVTIKTPSGQKVQMFKQIGSPEFPHDGVPDQPPAHLDNIHNHELSVR